MMCIYVIRCLERHEIDFCRQLIVKNTVARFRDKLLESGIKFETHVAKFETLQTLVTVLGVQTLSSPSESSKQPAG